MLPTTNINYSSFAPAKLLTFKGMTQPFIDKGATYLLAFDLDGTFLECNKKDIENFLRLAKQRNCKLAYVSARNVSELKKIQEDFARKGIYIPKPNYFAANNGQFLYENIGGKMVISEDYYGVISATKFNRDHIKTAIADFIRDNQIQSKHAMLQFDHRPSEFNIEYLIHDKIRNNLPQKLTKHLQKYGIEAKFILDFVPAKAVEKGIAKLPNFDKDIKHMLTKDGSLYALNVAAVNKADSVEFLRNKLKVDMNHVVTAGNGANDLSMAAKGYWFILVNNAQKILKDLIKNLSQDKIIQATKNGTAGINEALEKIFATVGICFK